MSAIIHGASDDLIRIDGDIQEEFPAGEDAGAYLGFSDGTVLKIEYNERGCWRITLVHPGTTTYIHTRARGEDTGPREDGTPGHSDVVRLQGSIAWAICGGGIAVKKS